MRQILLLSWFYRGYHGRGNTVDLPMDEIIFAVLKLRGANYV